MDQLQTLAAEAADILAPKLVIPPLDAYQWALARTDLQVLLPLLRSGELTAVLSDSWEISIMLKMTNVSDAPVCLPMSAEDIAKYASLPKSVYGPAAYASSRGVAVRAAMLKNPLFQEALAAIGV